MSVRFSCITAAAIWLTTLPVQAGSPPSYDLIVEIRSESHSIRVGGTWTVPAAYVEKGSRGAGARKFTFVSSDKLLNLRLTFAGSPIPIRCQPDDGQLKCIADFTTSLRPAYRFDISYESDGKPVAQLRIDADQAFAGSSGDYWYPQVAAQGVIGKVRFDTPKQFHVVAPGQWVARSAHGETASTDYRMDAPVKLGFAAAPFHVYGRGMCTVYLLQEDPKANLTADGCQRIATALTHIWGSFPGGDIKIVEVNFKGVLLGVGESGYILADSSEIRRDFETNYWAHEISHQWWGSSLQAIYPSPGAMLLTEGMAEYGALSVNRELNGKQGEADYLSDRLANEPSGAPMAHYLKILARHEDLPLTSVTDGDGTQLHYVVTSKGVMTIDMLANEIGPQLFRGLCAEFLKVHAGDSVTWKDFEEFLATRSGKHSSWFHSQWFDRPGLPLLYTTWSKAGDGIDVTLHQCGVPYRLNQFPLLVRFTDADGNDQNRMVSSDFNGATSTVHFARLSDVYRVNPDPDHSFLWLPGLCPEAQ